MVAMFTIAVTFFLGLGAATELTRPETEAEFKERIVKEAMEHNEAEFDRAEDCFNG